MFAGAPTAGCLAGLVLLLVLVAILALLCAAGFAGARPAVVGGGRRRITTSAVCFPPELMVELLAAVRGRGFAPPTERERAKYAAAAARLAAKYAVPVPVRALTSAHSQERALRARARTGGGAARWDAKLRAARRGGLSAVAAAAKLDLPPMFVLKALARLKDPATPAEAKAAALADAGSSVRQRASHARADAYEAEVGRDLTRLGVAHRTEDDLRAEGSRLTPDFLLDKPLAIGGRAVSWIDAKNYAYYGNRLTLPGLRRQARKYTAAFGPGAMVFAGGRACAAPELGALLLGPGWAAKTMAPGPKAAGA